MARTATCPPKLVLHFFHSNRTWLPIVVNYGQVTVVPTARDLIRLWKPVMEPGHAGHTALDKRELTSWGLGGVWSKVAGIMMIHIKSPGEL